MKKAEEAYERALASLRVLEQSCMGDMVAKSTGPIDGTDAKAGPINGTDTKARPRKDEQSTSDMEAAAAKSTRPADTEASEDERATVAAGKSTAIATDSTDTEAKADEDVQFVDGEDNEARAGMEEMKLIDDDVKIELETGKRKRADYGTMVKRDQGQSTFKIEKNSRTYD